MKLQDIKLLNDFKMLLLSIYKMFYVYAGSMFIMAHLIIFIMMLEKILLAENFANLQPC